MKWIKHDTDANQDAKLQNVLLDYGLEGYGLYWYCLELIAGKVDKDNINFDLEHDARIIARNTGSTPQKVEEMMRYFVRSELFESSEGVITCLKLAKRLDKSMTSNPQMRGIIENLKSHDGVMTQSENHMQDEIRLDKNRIDNKDPFVEQKPNDKKYKYSDVDYQLAEWIFNLVKSVAPKSKDPNFEKWASTIRLMRERDNLNHQEISTVFQWANNHSFWKTNILSVDKLREQYPQLQAKKNQEYEANKRNFNNGNEKPITAAQRTAAAFEKRNDQRS